MKIHNKLAFNINLYKKYYGVTTCIGCGASVAKYLFLWCDVYTDDNSKKEKILRCKVCGLGYTYPFLSSEELLKLYTKDYAAYTHDDVLASKQTFFYSLYVSLEKHVLEFCLNSNNIFINKLLTSFSAYFFQTYPIYNHKKNNSKIRIMDYGCGAGHFLYLAKQAGAEVYGIEIDNDLIKYLQKKGITASTSLNSYINSNFKFDVVRANQVLEHVKDPREYLRNFHKILHSDGELIIGVPNFDTPSRIFREYFFMHLPFHRLHYTKKSITNLLEQCDFEVKYIKTKSSGFFSRSWFSSLKIKSSIYTLPIKLFEVFIVSFIFDVLGIGDCLEVYAVKKVNL